MGALPETEAEANRVAGRAAGRHDLPMSPPPVTLRDMRPDEYDDYTEWHVGEYVQSLQGSLPVEAAREKTRQDLARYLPDGLATERHRILVVEDAAGETVGYTWLGLDEPGGGSPEMAWLYDIRVLPAYRRRGYARAILAAVEALAREAGALRLGLNVFGHNRAAIALYDSQGYQVTAQHMAKPL